MVWPVGLQNLGNTCFCNSVLQALTSSDVIHQAIEASSHSYTCQKNRGVASETVNEGASGKFASHKKSGMSTANVCGDHDEIYFGAENKNSHHRVASSSTSSSSTSSSSSYGSVSGSNPQKCVLCALEKHIKIARYCGIENEVNMSYSTTLPSVDNGGYRIFHPSLSDQTSSNLKNLGYRSASINNSSSCDNNHKNTSQFERQKQQQERLFGLSNNPYRQSNRQQCTGDQLFTPSYMINQSIAKNIISPHEIVELLPLLSTSLKRGRQEDSHEFLNALLTSCSTLTSRRAPDCEKNDHHNSNNNNNNNYNDINNNNNNNDNSNNNDNNHVDNGKKNYNINNNDNTSNNDYDSNNHNYIDDHDNYSINNSRNYNHNDKDNDRNNLLKNHSNENDITEDKNRNNCDENKNKDINKDCSLLDLFSGTVQNSIKCCTCGSISKQTDHILGLQLDITRAGTLLSALGEYCRIEILSGSNAYDCSKCEKRSTAERDASIQIVPYVLAVQFKRFYRTKFDENKKLDHFVEYGLELDLNEFLSNERTEILVNEKNERIVREKNSSGERDRRRKEEEEGNEQVCRKEHGQIDTKLRNEKMKCQTQNSKMQLFAVIVHLGCTINNGHYIAYVRCSLSGHWYKTDDSVVTYVTEEEALGQKDAYLLFYENKEHSLKSSDPSSSFLFNSSPSSSSFSSFVPLSPSPPSSSSSSSSSTSLLSSSLTSLSQREYCGLNNRISSYHVNGNYNSDSSMRHNGRTVYNSRYNNNDNKSNNSNYDSSNNSNYDSNYNNHSNNNNNNNYSNSSNNNNYGNNNNCNNKNNDSKNNINSNNKRKYMLINVRNDYARKDGFEFDMNNSNYDKKKIFNFNNNNNNYSNNNNQVKSSELNKAENRKGNNVDEMQHNIEMIDRNEKENRNKNENGKRQFNENIYENVTMQEKFKEKKFKINNNEVRLSQLNSNHENPQRFFSSLRNFTKNKMDSAIKIFKNIIFESDTP